MSDDSSDGQRQCRRAVDVELDAAMVLADMAGGASEHQPPRPLHQSAAEDEDELASTRLSLELGKVGIQSGASPCSSSSSAGGGGHAHHHHQQSHIHAAAPATGYGPRPRHTLTEAEKEAKRLRRVLANRESARQTILRRQAIRDELARKVADLSSQNENMKKEKDMVMQEYLSLKEANKQLKEQVARTTTKKQPPATTGVVTTATAVPMHVTASAEAMAATASPPATPPQPGFLYTAAPPAVPVPYVWGSWPPGPGFDHHPHHHGGSSPPPTICLPPPCAWYYPVVADPRGSPSAFAPPQQQPVAFPQQHEPAGSGGATAEEDTDDDPCSLTLGLDVADKRSAPINIEARGGGAGPSDRDKAATAAEARKRRKELTKLKHMQHAAGGRPGGGEQW